MHVMIDLETLGTSPDAKILSIGIAAFDFVQEGSQSVFSSVVSLDSQNGSVDEGTLQWWSNQSQLARETAFAIERQHPAAAAQSVIGFLGSQGGIEGVWAHGAGFDLPILRTFLASQGYKRPWNHQLERDTRTLAMVIRSLGEEPPTMCNATHVAIQDAIDQVYWVQHMHHRLQGMMR